MGNSYTEEYAEQQVKQMKYDNLIFEKDYGTWDPVGEIKYERDFEEWSNSQHE